MKTESEQGWETDGGALHGPRVRGEKRAQIKPTVKLDSYYEWFVEKMRGRLREAQGTGGDLSVLMAVLDSVLDQVNVDVTEAQGCAYKDLTKALREKAASDRFGWTDADTLKTTRLLDALGRSARSCASCGVPLTLEREIHVCTECARKGNA